MTLFSQKGQDTEEIYTGTFVRHTGRAWNEADTGREQQEPPDGGRGRRTLPKNLECLCAALLTP